MSLLTAKSVFDLVYSGPTVDDVEVSVDFESIKVSIPIHIVDVPQALFYRCN